MRVVGRDGLLGCGSGTLYVRRSDGRGELCVKGETYAGDDGQWLAAEIRHVLFNEPAALAPQGRLDGQFFVLDARELLALRAMVDRALAASAGVPIA